MDKFVIKGGARLKGTVRISGAKNSALPILAAALLTDQRIVLHNVPRIEDVQAMLLLLDDLQWARESLLPLRKLARVIGGLPVLVVGSFRDDERPDIPGELPGVGVIKLERFPTDKIAELSASMLGDAGRQPQIVAFLERETEGNAFFMVVLPPPRALPTL